MKIYFSLSGNLYDAINDIKNNLPAIIMSGTKFVNLSQIHEAYGYKDDEEELEELGFSTFEEAAKWFTSNGGAIYQLRMLKELAPTLEWGNLLFNREYGVYRAYLPEYLSDKTLEDIAKMAGLPNSEFIRDTILK